MCGFTRGSLMVEALFTYESGRIKMIVLSVISSMGSKVFRSHGNEEAKVKIIIFLLRTKTGKSRQPFARKWALVTLSTVSLTRYSRLNSLLTLFEKSCFSG